MMPNPYSLDFAALDFNQANTPVSPAFDDVYFCNQDGLAESHYVFFEGNRLVTRWAQCTRAHFTIAETGFGTGLNFLAVMATFRAFRAENPDAPLKRLYFLSFEKFPLHEADLAKAHQHFPQFAQESAALRAQWQPELQGCSRFLFNDIYLDLWFGDLNQWLTEVDQSQNGQIDCWFLDGFSPDKNPEMWQAALYAQMFRLTRAGGSFATFTAASAVRKGLIAAGFEVSKRKGFGKKREMLLGEKPLDALENALAFPHFYQPTGAPSAEPIAIIGGGVASFWLALSLIERGQAVTIYSADSAPAQSASGNAQGAFYPQLSDDDTRNVRFYLHAFDFARKRLNRLVTSLPLDLHYSGVALLAYNPKNQQKWQKIREQGWDLPHVHWLDANAMAEKTGLDTGLSGVFLAQAGWLSPAELMQKGFAYLQSLGVKIEFFHRVSALEATEHGWQWQHAGQTIRHRQVVLANGAQIRDFAQTQAIPFYPVRGQVSYLREQPQLSGLKCVICFDGYLTPANQAGQHCLGATHLRDDRSLDWRANEHQTNLDKFAENVPQPWAKITETTEPQGRVGIRCALRDRLPMVGSVPNFEAQQQQFHSLHDQLRRQSDRHLIPQASAHHGLFLLGGLGSRGMTTAPLLAELAACQLLNEPLPLSQDLWQALNPSRTWLRRWIKSSPKAPQSA